MAMKLILVDLDITLTGSDVEISKILQPFSSLNKVYFSYLY